MFGFIYETVNLVTGMKYIGQHKCTGDVNDPTDEWYLGSGSLLKEDLRLYGRDSFRRVILVTCEDQQSLDEAERKIIADSNAVQDPMYYNIAHGGGGSWFTDKGRKRMSEAATMKFQDPDKKRAYQHPHAVTDAVRTAAKIRARSRVGIPVEDPNVTRKRMTGEGNPQYGRPKSEEFKSMIRETLTGIKRDSHHRKATSDANVGMKFINNGTITKRARGEELERLLAQGWKLGQSKKGVL